MAQDEMLSLMKEKQRDALSSERHQYNRARSDMNKWLTRDDVSEDSTAMMYAQELQKVNRLKNQALRPQPLPVQMVPPPTTSTETPAQKEATEQQEPTNILEKQIVDSVPKTMQSRAKLLIRTMKQHPDVLGWNERGQLVYEGSAVPHSNIVDLVNDVLRKRKGFHPEHSKTFLKGLAS